MKPTDDLYNLIQSLSQSEKRYIKVFASKHLIKEENNYLRLLDILLSQKAYNEAEVKEAFKDKSFVRHLSSEKVYLYSFILKSMRSFHAGKTVDLRLKESYVDARFLYDKRQYSQCEKQLVKAKSLANAYERYNSLLEILELETRVRMERNSKSFNEEISRLIDEHDTALKNFQNVQNYLRLQTQLFLLTRQDYQLRDKDLHVFVNAVMNDPLLQDSTRALSNTAKRIYFFCHALFGLLRGDYEYALDSYLAILNAWEENVLLMEEDSIKYKLIISNYLNVCVQVNRFEEFPEWLGKLKSPSKTADEDAELFQNIYYLELIYLMKTQQYVKAMDLIPMIEDGLNRYKDKVNSARLLAFSYNIALLFYFVEDYQRALAWLARILNDGSSKVRMDIQRFSQIFLFLIHLELSNSELLEYLIRSYLRKSKNKLGDFESIIIKHIRKLMWCPSKSDSLRVLEDFEAELKNVVSNKEATQQFIGIQEVDYWIQKQRNKLALA